MKILTAGCLAAGMVSSIAASGAGENGKQAKCTDDLHRRPERLDRGVWAGILPPGHPTSTSWLPGGCFLPRRIARFLCAARHGHPS
ncbi:MAG: hypothetical protein AB2L24_19685 [Mangrovibacterium sp.]